MGKPRTVAQSEHFPSLLDGIKRVSHRRIGKELDKFDLLAEQIDLSTKYETGCICTEKEIVVRRPCCYQHAESKCFKMLLTKITWNCPFCRFDLFDNEDGMFCVASCMCLAVEKPDSASVYGTLSILDRTSSTV